MEPTQELIDELYREKVRQARAMSPEERMLAGPRLFDFACRIMADGIRHQNPGISEVEVMRLLEQRLEMARRLEDAL